MGQAPCDHVPRPRAVPRAADVARIRADLAPGICRTVRRRMAGTTPARERRRGSVAMRRVLYLIRHGRSDLDSNDMSSTRRGDQYDPPLSAEGREQAALLARRL